MRCCHRNTIFPDPRALFWPHHHACFDFKTVGTLRDALFRGATDGMALSIDGRNLGVPDQEPNHHSIGLFQMRWR